VATWYWALPRSVAHSIRRESASSARNMSGTDPMVVRAEELVPSRVLARHSYDLDGLVLADPVEAIPSWVAGAAFVQCWG
jgi:hypothetical protein